MQSDEYEDTLRYLEYVDTITLTPYKDNTDFTIEMIIEKAYPYEYQSFNGCETAFYIKCTSTSYDSLAPKPTIEASNIWISGVIA
ncbi:MAG: hypothetical protein OMM_11988 [Candidatus Magnetoglobus multicellularis str. Araruama]|uniref:Uncharacterized protein n=1 Tax=Candidatus Magnetoglobus multicellularis str. Araruama TaxID=890399 RepID=A0A1V1NWT5_9BACT|nr:MAG: hypothetical protein OMM_11988 [Candidatus Magnetoglobus multicellularis str. Araruama]